MRKEKHIRKPPPLLVDIPVDIVFEIMARVDAVTLVRCAAASKEFRRQITDPVFLRQYHADAGYVPSALLGMFLQHGRYEPYRFVSMPPPSTKLTLQSSSAGATDDDFEFESCVPVTSRAGQVLLRRVDDSNLVTLCVYSPVTGRNQLLPPATIYDYSHVLLPGHGDDDDNTAHDSFRLLIVDQACRTQIFSTKTGRWEQLAVATSGAALSSYRRVRPAAVVLGGMAHWLYQDPSSGRYQVVAVRVSDGHASETGEVPAESCLRRRCTNRKDYLRGDKDLLLVSTDARQLGLLVADVMAISLWTWSEDSRSWGDRRVVVDRMSMLRSVELHLPIVACAVHVDLEWFGEASGTVALKGHGTGIILLNLRTKEITEIKVTYEHARLSFRGCPYELDLVSLLGRLQPF
jgi:hypothetical protein